MPLETSTVGRLFDQFFVDVGARAVPTIPAHRRRRREGMEVHRLAADEPRRGGVDQAGVAPIDDRVELLAADKLHRQPEFLDARQRHAHPGRLPGAAAAGRPPSVGRPPRYRRPTRRRCRRGSRRCNPRPNDSAPPRPRNGRCVPTRRKPLRCRPAFPGRARSVRGRDSTATPSRSVGEDPTRLPHWRQIVEINARLVGCPKAAAGEAARRDDASGKNDALRWTPLSQ